LGDIYRDFVHECIEFVKAPVNIAHHKDFVHDDNQNYRNKKARPGRSSRVIPSAFASCSAV
jgi:hypothetical protein